MSIKVLVISDYRSYHTVRPEAEIFIGLAKLGVEVHIMTFGDAKYNDEFRKAGIKVIDFHPQKKLDKQEIARIRQQLVDEQYDILQLYNNFAIINGIKAAKGLPVKIVLYRGYAGHVQWYDPINYLKFLNPRVDKIICNSEGVAQSLQKQLFFDKSKTVTINKGHRVEWYAGTEPIDVKKEYNIPEDAFVIVNVANNRKMKGIPYLLKAMCALPADMPVHLLLIGNNLDNKDSRKIINGNVNAGKIHFLGFRNDALNIVAGCDAFVLSSISGESITKSVIEAMSLGKPPIITDIAGNKELVVDNESGLVVPSKNADALKDAIIRLYNDKPLRERLGVNAKARIANELNTNQTILKTKQLYEELVGHQ